MGIRQGWLDLRPVEFEATEREPSGTRDTCQGGDRFGSFIHRDDSRGTMNESVLKGETLWQNMKNEEP